MKKTDLLNAFGNILMELMENFEIEDDDMLEALVSEGLSEDEINGLGLFDKKDVKEIIKNC